MDQKENKNQTYNNNNNKQKRKQKEKKEGHILCVMECKGKDKGTYQGFRTRMVYLKHDIYSRDTPFWLGTLITKQLKHQQFKALTCRHLSR